jgi:hypothetical protein
VIGSSGLANSSAIADKVTKVDTSFLENGILFIIIPRCGMGCIYLTFFHPLLGEPFSLSLYVTSITTAIDLAVVLCHEPIK